jgi:teichuronic acid biosynthesis glycosyltransferase TuaG
MKAKPRSRSHAAVDFTGGSLVVGAARLFRRGDISMIHCATRQSDRGAALSVSAIIPFYNSADTLERALISVARQTHPALEILVVDDASADVQAAMAEAIVSEFKIARMLHHDCNKGPSAARNTGTKAARGNYVAFLDADDYWLDDKLEQCLQIMNEQGIDFIGHNNIICGQSKHTINDRIHFRGRLYRMNILDIFISTSQFAPSTVVFRKGAMPVVFDESIFLSEDYRLWGELVFNGFELWKLRHALSVREEPHIRGAGLSGNVERLLSAHVATLEYFAAQGFISESFARWAMLFMKLKFIRHR